MSDTIGSMTAVVRATAGQFQSDIKTVTNSLDSLKSSGDSVASSSLFSGGLEIGAGIESFHKAVELAQEAVAKFFETIEQGHQIEAMASELSTSVTALEGFRFAVALSGQEAEAADRSLAKMQEHIGNAREGNEEAGLAFRALGLDINKLAGESSTDAFKSIADGFTNIKSPSDQAALAVEIFEQGGLGMLNVLREGSEGIDNMTEEQKEAGRAYTDESAEKMSAASIEIKKMKAAWQGLWNQLTVAVLPVLKEIVDAFTWIIQTAREAADAIEEAFTGHKTTRAEVTKPQVEQGENIVSKMKREATERKKAAEESTKAAKEAAKEQEKAREELAKRAAAVVKGAESPFDKFKAEMDEFNKLLTVGAISWDQYSKASTHAAEELEKVGKQHEHLATFKETKGLAAAVRGTAGGFSGVQEANRGQEDIARYNAEIAAEELEESKRQSQLLEVIAANTIARNEKVAVF